MGKSCYVQEAHKLTGKDMLCIPLRRKVCRQLKKVILQSVLARTLCSEYMIKAGMKKSNGFIVEKNRKKRYNRDRGKRVKTEWGDIVDYNKYIHKLLQSFRDNRNMRYMFIKHYNTLILSEQELHQIIVHETSDVCLLLYSFPMHQMLEPYGPFLTWIRELYYQYFQEQTPEEFVANAGVYSLLQPVFATYIRTGMGARKEDIFITELEYERGQVLDSMLHLYEYIAERRPLFVFLEQLHLANVSCVRFLYALITKGKSIHIQMVGIYNELFRIPEYLQKDWKQFVEEIGRQNLQYDWAGVGAEEKVEVYHSFVPNREYIEEYLRRGANMYFFLALEDAQQSLNMIYNYKKQGNLEMTEQQSMRCYQLYAMILILNQKYTKALQMTEYLGELAKAREDDAALYTYYYISAMCQYGMKHMENKVDSYIDQCQRIASRQGNELAQYKAESIRVLSKFNYFRDFFERDITYQVSEEFFEQTKRLGFINMLAHLCVFGFDDDEKTVRSVIDGTGEQKYFKQGIALGEQMNNLQFLVSAYAKNSVVFFEYGCYDVVEELCRKRLELLDDSMEPICLAHAYNGLGYYAGVAEQYQKAEEYFEKSLAEALRLKAGEEIAITLYNSAVNKMLAMEYTGAAEDLELVLQVMELLQLQSIDLCDTSRLYGMLGFCSYYMGEEYRCYLCLNRIEPYVCHLEAVEDENKYKNWTVTLFFQHMIRGMLCSGENQLEEAEKEFQQAKFFVDQDLGNWYFIYPIYIVEMAKLYGKQGKEEQRMAVLEEGMKRCNEKGYHQKETYLVSMLRNNSGRMKCNFHSQRQISDAQIMETISNLAVEKQLAMNKKDIDFMVIWQELLSQTINPNEMLEQAVSIMKNYFNMDGVAVFEKTEDGMAVKYLDGPEEQTRDTDVTNRIRAFGQPELERLFAFFQKRKQSLLVNRIDKNFMECKPLLELLDINHVVTLYAFPHMDQEGEVESVLMGYVEMQDNFIGNAHLLMERDYVILNFFSNQLCVAMEKLEYLEIINRMNSQLQDMAVTDLLTGLYNRQGFEKQLEKDSERYPEDNLLIYIDLDNFKYYNDTFGHQLGDFVLLRFAQLLERVVDNVGYAVRYGGDEFLIVIHGKSLEFGKRVAKNILYNMTEHFQTVIEQRLGADIAIPKEKHLSCSIGITRCHGYDTRRIQDALNRADKALYCVKKASKNSFMVWEEMDQV